MSILVDDEMKLLRHDSFALAQQTIETNSVDIMHVPISNWKLTASRLMLQILARDRLLGSYKVLNNINESLSCFLVK